MKVHTQRRVHEKLCRHTRGGSLLFAASGCMCYVNDVSTILEFQMMKEE